MSGKYSNKPFIRINGKAFPMPGRLPTMKRRDNYAS